MLGSIALINKTVSSQWFISSFELSGANWTAKVGGLYGEKVWPSFIPPAEGTKETSRTVVYKRVN